MADTVASISFNNNHSISMDMEGISTIEVTEPLEVSPGNWASSLILRSIHGVVALQLLSDSHDKLTVTKVD
ncbi:MAG: hypothetical protein HQL45_10560 [Alphaproteobacteria bacterium]|nr:hypothetical protein [Alphaproteobacteria bacterium]MBF0355802.1 hypothetical protein [Alphaproteobacteria bacterium]